MKVLHAAEVVKGGVSTVMRQLLEDQYSWDKIGKVVCVIPENQKRNYRHITLNRECIF